jgi:hypothetical protein
MDRNLLVAVRGVVAMIGACKADPRPSEIKAKYDPGNLFRLNSNALPAVCSCVKSY